MTLLGIALSGALALCIAAVALFSMYTAVQFKRPDVRTAAYHESAVWFVGIALLWTALLAITGGVFGAASLAVWRLLG